MSLSKKIAAALDENTKAYVLPCTVTVEDSPSRLTLNLTALDSVGVAFDAWSSPIPAGPDWSSDALKEWGDRLAERVTYLMEPLKVLEIDAGGARSRCAARRPPRADQRGFYEMRLFRQGSLRMERYVFRRRDSPAPRSSLPAHARSSRTPGRRHRRQRGVKHRIQVPGIRDSSPGSVVSACEIDNSWSLECLLASSNLRTSIYLEVLLRIDRPDVKERSLEQSQAFLARRRCQDPGERKPAKLSWRATGIVVGCPQSPDQRAAVIRSDKSRRPEQRLHGK